jgi:hypothetical protein
MLTAQCAAPRSPSVQSPEDKERVAMSQVFTQSNREGLRVAQIKVTYIGEQEKPVPSLIASSIVFKLTPDRLQELSNTIPKEVMAKLLKLQDIEVLSRGDFRAACRAMIGRDEFIRRGQEITAAAIVPAGKKVPLDAFQAVQGGKSYGNDPLPYTKWVDATPEELVKMWATLDQSRASHPRPPDRPSVSFSWLRELKAPPGGQPALDGGELLLGYDDGRALIGELARGLDPENTTGRGLFDDAVKRL